MYKYSTLDHVWRNTLGRLLNAKTVDSRLGPTKEIVGYQIFLASTDFTFLVNECRALSPYYACAETLWYLSYQQSINMIKAYAPQYEKFAEDGIAHGAYGYRLWSNLWMHNNQLAIVINILAREPNSRQAIITMWTAQDDLGMDDKKDLPCTLSMQFLIRDERVCLIVTMRSNDAWLGLPYDIFAFTCIQKLVAQAVGREPGWYCHQAGSEHLYKKDWDKAKEASEVKFGNPPTDGWSVAPIENWDAHRQAALDIERDARVSHVWPMQNNDTMLMDLAICCADKWHRALRSNDGCIRVESPALRKGIENVNR